MTLTVFTVQRRRGRFLCTHYVGGDRQIYARGEKIESDADFSAYLIDAVGVVCVHGEAFGLSPHFRISYATSVEVLKDACSRIQKACAELRDQAQAA